MHTRARAGDGSRNLRKHNNNNSIQPTRADECCPDERFHGSVEKKMEAERAHVPVCSLETVLRVVAVVNASGLFMPPNVFRGPDALQLFARRVSG